MVSQREEYSDMKFNFIFSIFLILLLLVINFLNQEKISDLKQKIEELNQNICQPEEFNVSIQGKENIVSCDYQIKSDDEIEINSCKKIT